MPGETHTQDTPASIPVAALAFAGTIAPMLGYFLHIEQAGVVVLSAFIMGAAGFAVAIFLNRTTTSTSSPVLTAGTTVGVQGSDDTVTIQRTPPGPTGQD